MQIRHVSTVVDQRRKVNIGIGDGLSLDWAKNVQDRKRLDCPITICDGAVCRQDQPDRLARWSVTEKSSADENRKKTRKIKTGKSKNRTFRKIAKSVT